MSVTFKKWYEIKIVVQIFHIILSILA